MSQADVRALVGRYSGQHNTLTLQRPYIEFCNRSVEGGLFLSQILYWADRSNDDGWFYKSYKDWESEIFVGEKSIRSWSRKFEGFLEVKNRRAPNGSPTLHYHLKWDAFLAVFSGFLQGSSQGLATIPLKGGMETAQGRNGNSPRAEWNPPEGEVDSVDRAESTIYTSTTSSTTSSTTAKERACKKVDRLSLKKIQLPEQEEKIDHSTNPEGPGAARAVVHEFVEAELVEEEPRSPHPINQGLGRAALDIASVATRTACDRQTHALVCTARQDASFVRFKSVYSRLANVVSGRPNGFGNSQAAEEEWMQLRADGYEVGEAFWAGLDAFREQSIAAFNAEGRVIGFKGARNFLRDRDWEQALETQADLEAIKALGFKSKSEKSKAEIAAEERAASSARVYAKLKAEGRCR